MTAPRTPPVSEQMLCRTTDLANGTSRGFDPLGEGRDSMFLVRKDDRFHAWRNECPHDRRANMARSKDAYLNADRSRIKCASHGAAFDIATGRCVIGACFGQFLTKVEIEIRGDEIWLTGPFAPADPPRSAPEADHPAPPG